MPLKLMWTRSSFFLFKYDAVIIEQPPSCSFGKKVVKFWKIINHRCLVPFTNLAKCRSLNPKTPWNQLPVKNSIIIKFINEAKHCIYFWRYTHANSNIE